MKRFISLICCLLMMSSLTLCLAEGESDVEDTEFDLSAEQEKIEELGIPTIESVDKLKEEADALWENKDYKEAASAYANYAKQANWLANIISAGLEPYYGASYDDRKSWYPKDLSYSELSSAESTSNKYKSERNRAMLYEGLCYYNQNDYETALPLLIKALDLIEINDEVNWGTGMDALYAIIGYK